MLQTSEGCLLLIGSALERRLGQLRQMNNIRQFNVIISQCVCIFQTQDHKKPQETRFLNLPVGP